MAVSICYIITTRISTNLFDITRKRCYKRIIMARIYGLDGNVYKESRRNTFFASYTFK